MGCHNIGQAIGLFFFLLSRNKFKYQAQHNTIVTVRAVYALQQIRFERIEHSALSGESNNNTPFSYSSNPHNFVNKLSEWLIH